MKYKAEYIWSNGDEDPFGCREFEAKNDEDALNRAANLGRKGDRWKVYRVIDIVTNTNKKRS